MDRNEEQAYYEALGLEAPAEGAQEQEPADPAQQSAGAQEQDLADPAQPPEDDPEDFDTDDPETEAGSADHDAGDHGAEKPPLTKEERRANAARRREQEKQEAIDKALAEERAKNDKQVEEILGSMGLRDSATGEPIKTMEQFEAYKKTQANARLQQNLKEGKLTREDIGHIVSESMQAQQAAAQQQADRQAQEAEAQQRINQELQRIMEMDQSIKSMGDLLKMPGASEFREKIHKGYSLIDAFKLVRGPELEKAKNAAAQQAAMNNLRGKEHLRSTGGSRGAGADSVPKAELDMYRLFNPGATDAQIQAHYNKNKRK